MVLVIPYTGLGLASFNSETMSLGTLVARCRRHTDGIHHRPVTERDGTTVYPRLDALAGHRFKVDGIPARNAAFLGPAYDPVWTDYDGKGSQVVPKLTDGQSNDVRDLLARGVDAVLMSPVESAALMPAARA